MSKYQEFRNILEERKRKLSSRLGKINRDLRQDGGPLSADFQEQATELENKEVLEALEISGRKELDEIHLALARIEEGTYDLCIRCEDEISEGRLRALPFTRLCIDCANKAEKH